MYTACIIYHLSRHVHHHCAGSTKKHNEARAPPCIGGGCIRQRIHPTVNRTLPSGSIKLGLDQANVLLSVASVAVYSPPPIVTLHAHHIQNHRWSVRHMQRFCAGSKHKSTQRSGSNSSLSRGQQIQQQSSARVPTSSPPPAIRQSSYTPSISLVQAIYLQRNWPQFVHRTPRCHP